MQEEVEFVMIKILLMWAQDNWAPAGPVLVVHGVREVLRLERDAHIVRVALHSVALSPARRAATAAGVEPIRCVHLDARLIGVELHTAPTLLLRDNRCRFSGRIGIENEAMVDATQPAIQVDSRSHTFWASV